MGIVVAARTDVRRQKVAFVIVVDDLDADFICPLMFVGYFKVWRRHVRIISSNYRIIDESRLAFII